MPELSEEGMLELAGLLLAIVSVVWGGSKASWAGGERFKTLRRVGNAIKRTPPEG